MQLNAEHPQSRKESRRFLRLLALTLLLFNFAVWGVTYGYIEQRHTHYVERATTQALERGRLLAEDISGLLKKIDLALQVTVSEVERQRRSGVNSAQNTLDFLTVMHARVPETDGFRVVDADGIVRHATGEFKRNQDLSDRAYFQQQKSNPDAGLVLSQPLFGRIVSRWGIMISRRLNRPNGEFDGIVYVPLNPVVLSQLFGNLDVGAHGIIALRNQQLEILARHPLQDSEGKTYIGRKVSTPGLQEALSSDKNETSFSGKSSLDGIERTLSFVRIKDAAGLNLSVGLAGEDYLTEWYRERHIALLGTGFCSLCSLLSAYFIWRGWHRRQADIRELSWQETRMRAFAQASADWFWEIDKQGRIIWISPGMKDKTNIDSMALTGHTFAEISAEPGDELKQLLITFQHQRPFNDWRLSLRDKQGELRYFSLNGIPVADSNSIFQGYLGSGKDVTAKVFSERHFRFLAHHDPLTGLPNRALFEDRVEQALLASARNQQRLALMFIDLDEFKPINDTHGHAMGDALLVAVAQRMTAAVRATDTVARLGGDEFLVLLPEIEDATAAQQVGEKLRSVLELPFAIEGQHFAISCSIGIVLYPDHGLTLATLSDASDSAMYQAKENGRNMVVVFTPLSPTLNL